MSPDNFPILKAPQVAVVMAERATGIVLNADKTRSTSPDPTRFQLFPTLDLALMTCRDAVERDPAVEFIVFDQYGAYLQAVRSERPAPRPGRWGWLSGMLQRR